MSPDKERQPFFGVRHIGLEPTRLSTPDPKSGAATNYANAAERLFGCKGTNLFAYMQIKSHIDVEIDAQ